MDNFEAKLKEPQGIYKAQQGINWHLQGWRHQERAFEHDCQHPPPRALCTVADFADRSRGEIIPPAALEKLR